MPASGRKDSIASKSPCVSAGPPCSSNTFVLPDPRRLVQTLYLPPTTGIIRMPATRTPAGGLIAATAAASALPDSGAAGDWASSDQGNIPSPQLAATTALR